MITLHLRFSARPDHRAIFPLGLSTPHSAPLAVAVTGGTMSTAMHAETGQVLAVVSPTEDMVSVHYEFGLGGAPYPDCAFQPRDSRYTRSADALCQDAQSVAAAAGGGRAGLLALMQHTAAQFDYGHPEGRYYDDHDHVPQLCGLTQGSCVDINMYLLAALRAAGYEAGYITGYFVPEEKRDWCEDSHCWVVTRLDWVVEEWDIAHSLKLGTRQIAPGLNPKPGVRVAMAHSMGWSVPALGLVDQKLMGPPGWLTPDGHLAEVDRLDIRLDGKCFKPKLPINISDIL